ncbi:PTS system, Lactose/Cellobiose specific IIB subunit [Lactobacillus paragasseri JV-V03]|uniref:PTS system, Lactose/Cellobiose specific IIB subunit n=1 Tax=Lactobacillus paragasseri JV-V03 TaxID=525326 RepID=A0AA87DHF5_9LACO|nr:PTS sugar transporter subunit IIB [Lactobacillus paragasseri]EFJ69150.1 PTS system, Lactose/Cellobiose specific IIB subunit [Lactobacillus paragasseri JV-V03]
MKYRIMLLCAGGMSTSILMKKLDKYASENNIESSIEAVGLSSTSYLDEAKKYDIILMGPQVSYRIDEVKKATGKPVEAINPTDYALGNAKKIFEQAKKLEAQVK